MLLSFICFEEINKYINDINPNELLTMCSHHFCDKKIFEIDYFEIDDSNTKILLIFSYFYFMCILLFFFKIWLLVNKDNDNIKIFYEEYKRINILINLFYERYSSILNYENINIFCKLCNSLIKDEFKLNLEGITINDIKYFNLHFNRNVSYFINLSSSHATCLPFCIINKFCYYYALEINNMYHVNSLMNIFNILYTNFDYDLIKKFLIDCIKIYSQNNIDILRISRSSISNVYFKKKPCCSNNFNLKLISILNDHVMINYTKNRLLEIKEPTTDTLKKINYLNESNKYLLSFTEVFKNKNIFKEFIYNNLLNLDMENILSNNIEDYSFIEKNFNIVQIFNNDKNETVQILNYLYPIYFREISNIWDKLYIDQEFCMIFALIHGILLHKKLILENNKNNTYFINRIIKSNELFKLNIMTVDNYLSFL